MKRAAIILLQILVVLIGLVVLAFLLWEPHVEGRNVNATLYQIYFNDPFLAYAYFGSLSFFIGLYQLFRVLGYARQGRLLSPQAVRAVRIIKYCALAMLGFVALGEVFILNNDSDDRAPAVVMGLFVTICSTVTAIVAARYGASQKKAIH
ncbi:MAG: DUF2975 domain-containing protein, partial [Acidobacteriota bacterium]